MKKQFLEISPRFIVDDSGKKTEVVLDITTYEQMLEYLEDLYFGLKAKEAFQEDEYIDFHEANKDILNKK